MTAGALGRGDVVIEVDEHSSRDMAGRICVPPGPAVEIPTEVDYSQVRCAMVPTQPIRADERPESLHGADSSRLDGCLEPDGSRATDLRGWTAVACVFGSGRRRQRGPKCFSTIVGWHCGATRPAITPARCQESGLAIVIACCSTARAHFPTPGPAGNRTECTAKARCSPR